MLVRDLMTRDVISCGPDTTISEVLSVMQRSNVHQVPMVTTGDKHHIKGEIVGTVILNKIINRVLDPAKTKAQAVAISTAKLSPMDSLERAAELILGSNLRAIPVYEKGLKGIISEQDLMKAVSVSGTAGSIAKPCVHVGPDVSLGKVKEAMVHKSISRIVVLENGRPLGIVGTVDMIKVLSPGWGHYQAHSGGSKMSGKAGDGTDVRMQKGRGYMAPTRVDDLPLKNVVHDAPVVGMAEDLQRIAELLQTNDEVLVSGFPDGCFGIITHKDLLRSWLGERERALVVIQGLDREEGILDVARIQQKAAQIIMHIAGSGDLQPMKIYVKQHRKQGLKIKYSVKIEWPTSLGLFVATNEHGRDDKSFGELTTIVQKSLDDIERQIRNKQEEFRKPDRGYISMRRAEKEEGRSFRTRKIIKRKR